MMSVSVATQKEVSLKVTIVPMWVPETKITKWMTLITMQRKITMKMRSWMIIIIVCVAAAIIQQGIGASDVASFLASWLAQLRRRSTDLDLLLCLVRTMKQSTGSTRIGNSTTLQYAGG